MRRRHRGLLAAVLALAPACESDMGLPTEAAEEKPQPRPSTPPPPLKPVAREVAPGPPPRTTPFTRPRGIVSIGNPESTGSEISGAVRVLASMRSGFRDCYNRGLDGLPDFHASLQLTVGVGPAGEVTDVKAVGKLPPAAEKVVRPCLVERVRAVQFNPPHGSDGRTTLKFPVTLVVQPPGDGLERQVF